jgi:hypothetical protein
MKKNYVTALSILLSFSSLSQTPDWEWVFNAQGFSYDGVEAVTTDASGNVFIAGYFYGQSIDVGAATLYNANTTFTASDMFIAKFDSSGTFMWADEAGGNSYDGAYDLPQINQEMYMLQEIFSAHQSALVP